MSHAQRQRGITLIGLLFWGTIVAMLVILGMQVVPDWQEAMSVQHAVDVAAKSAQTVGGIRTKFDKMAEVDYINSISGKDLSITKVNGSVVVSYAYSKEIHLVGPAYLLLKFSGKSH